MKRILCGLAAVCMACCLLTSCDSWSSVRSIEEGDVILPESAGNDVAGQNYEPVARTDRMLLLLNRDTTQFRVENLADGEIYDSLPDSPASASERSLFELRYLDAKGNAAGLTSYDDSVKKGQYRVEKIDNGVKILFTLGNVQENLFVPKAVSKERFEAILEKIGDKFDRAQLKSTYYLADYTTLSEESKSALVSEYPSLKETPLYILRQSVLSLTAQREIHRLLVSAGYTEEDYAIDVQNSGELEKNAYPVFNLPLYITLKDDRLDVRIPLSEVEEFNGATITSLSLLRTFASPEPGETGRFFLPDGAGSAMNFYNGKNSQQEYQVPIYGRDGAVQQEEEIYKEEQAFLPIFGKQLENGGVLGMIVDGESMAEIHANPGDETNHASAYAYFRVRETAKTFLSSTAKDSNDFFTIAQKKLYDGDLAVNFAFFTEENNTLQAMATYYADSLYGGRPAGDGAASLYVELIGAASKEVPVFGLKVKREEVFTSLNEAREIGQQLLDGGVNRLVLRLTGFFTQGLDQPYAGALKLNKKTGTQEELEALQRWADDNGVELYFDIDVQYAAKDSLFDNFSKNKDVSTLLTKNLGIQYPYNMATGQMDTQQASRYILNPAAVSRAVQVSTGLYDTLGLKGASLQSIGLRINSDFKEGREISRQQALKILLEETAAVAENRPILTNGANAPLLPYLSHAVSLSMRSSRYDITDEMVPLLPMVLQGYVRYADQAVNLTGNTDIGNLSSLRTGAGFYYTLTARGGLGETQYNNYYSTAFSLWKADVLEKAVMLEETASLTASGITGTERLGAEVYATSYADGRVLVTNEGKTEAAVMGITVPAGGYRILDGKGGD